MSKICVVFEVDENILMNEVSDTGVESLSEAISQELGWVADSGLFVDSWKFVEESNNKEATKIKVMTDRGVVFSVLVNTNDPVEVEIVALDLDHGDNEQLAKYAHELQANPEYQECVYDIADFTE